MGYQRFAPTLWENIFFQLPVPICLLDETLTVLENNEQFQTFIHENPSLVIGEGQRLEICFGSLGSKLQRFLSSDKTSPDDKRDWQHYCRDRNIITHLCVRRLQNVSSGERECPQSFGLLTLSQFNTSDINQFRRFGLTKTEMKVVSAICSGSSNVEIAAMRNKSLDTINSQVKSILRKTGTKKRTELILMASQRIEVSA